MVKSVNYQAVLREFWRTECKILPSFFASGGNLQYHKCSPQWCFLTQQVWKFRLCYKLLAAEWWKATGKQWLTIRSFVHEKCIGTQRAVSVFIKFQW